MDSTLGQGVAGFDEALRRLRDALMADAMLADAVFADTVEWTTLLSHKLVPHLAGEGCLIAAVTGGTNTGKSTVFNMLLGRPLSPVVSTAAATRRPLIAASPTRAEQCLAARLVPEFDPQPFDAPEAVISRDSPATSLFVAECDALKDGLVLLDTPDVDSIEQSHWEVADNIRAAGDVLVAVLTGEKYKDERVIDFFREAHASGRVVAPVMNKANPADDFSVARRQLDEFRAEVGIDGPCFVVEHDFDLADRPGGAIKALDGGMDLRQYLETLDVAAIKREVYRGTVSHLVERARVFIDQATGVGEALRSVADEFDSRAASYAAKYDPAPGPDVGGLFHEFVQSRRGPVRRWIGSSSRAMAQTMGRAGRALRHAVLGRATLEADVAPESDADIGEAHARSIEAIARDLAASYIESCRNLREPAAHLLSAVMDDLDVDAAVECTVADTLGSESVSNEFRSHAYRLLESWWQDNTGKRRVLEALDALLALTPAAIAAPISMYTGGVGVPEAVVVAGPIVEQFVARVVEYQFGDAMFDFLSPWKREQQEALNQALKRHLTDVSLKDIQTYASLLEAGVMDDLRRWLDVIAACQ
jgi:Dynamin family